jgi:ribosomal protein L24E
MKPCEFCKKDYHKNSGIVFIDQLEDERHFFCSEVCFSYWFDDREKIYDNHILPALYVAE